MQISKDRVVSIEYALTDSEGELIDSSQNRGPLTYIHGHGNLIPGLESALEGRDIGENVNVTIPPQSAYGYRDEELVQSLPRDMFQGVDKLEVGMHFQASSGQETRIVTIVAIEGDDVKVDANHPLAGAALNFDVIICDVRSATEEEIARSHVHNADVEQPKCE